MNHLWTVALVVLASLIVIPAGQSFGQASPSVAGDSEEYQLVVASLQAQLKTLVVARGSCGAGLLSARQNEADAIDRAETRMYSRSRGGLTLLEKSSLMQAANNVAAQSQAMGSCSERVTAEQTRVETILANPQALQAQADKLRPDLRQYRAQLHSQLIALVTQGHSLAKALVEGAVPSNSAEQIEGFKKNVGAVRVSYAYFLGRGEEKELSSVASRLSAALSDAYEFLKPERYFAAEVAALLPEMKRSKFPEPSRVRYFQGMQAQHQEAQRQLATHQDILSKIIREPVMIALDLPVGMSSAPTK